VISEATLGFPFIGNMPQPVTASWFGRRFSTRTGWGCPWPRDRDEAYRRLRSS